MHMLLARNTVWKESCITVRGVTWDFGCRNASSYTIQSLRHYGLNKFSYKLDYFLLIDIQEICKVFLFETLNILWTFFLLACNIICCLFLWNLQQIYSPTLDISFLTNRALKNSLLIYKFISLILWKLYFL